MFYQQAFDFSGFFQISYFSEKKTCNFYCWDLCQKIWGWGRNSSNVQMLQICWLQNTFLALKKWIRNLDSGKKIFLSISTILEHSWQVKNILLGYKFPNTLKKNCLYLPPQFHHRFREVYCGQSRFDSWQLLFHQKMLYKML